VSISDPTKDMQPRERETYRKANSGLDQVNDDGDADCGAHESPQNGEYVEAAFKSQRTLAALFRRADPIRCLT
jgi:hypothetical protein